MTVRMLRLRVVDGWWHVEGEIAGFTPMGPTSYDSGVEYATEFLQAHESGGVLQIYNMEGKLRTTKPIPPAPAPENKLQSIVEQVEGPASKIAENVDKAIGREGGSPLGSLGSFDPLSLASKAAQQNPSVRLGIGLVAWSNATLAIVGVFGSGTSAAVIGGIASALKGSASLDSYLTFGKAFWATLPWSIAAALGMFMFLTGQFKNFHGAVGGWVIGSLLLSYILTSFGVSGPTAETLLEFANASGGSPLQQAFGVMAGYFAFFGAIPFLGGLVTGSALGVLLGVHSDNFVDPTK